MCTVSYRDPDGFTHSVEVSAESLYEVVVRGLAAFHQAELIKCTPGVGTHLEVSVHPPTATHTVPLTRLCSWLNAPRGRSPKEVYEKEKLRALVPWLSDGANVQRR
jgi:hypothetical protein